MKQKKKVSSHSYWIKVIFSSLLIAVNCISVIYAQVLPFQLNGKLLSHDKIVLLSYQTEEKHMVDTAKVKDGEFVFSGNIKEPTWAYLGREKPGEYTLEFYLEPGRSMTISADSIGDPNYVFSGSYTQEEAEQYRKQTKSFSSLDENIDFALNYAKNNPDSYIIVQKLNLFSSNLSLKQKEVLYTNLSPKIKKSVQGSAFLKKIINERAVLPGQPSKLFEARDMGGDIVKLLDYKGKYVLLDFWASWCIPCRNLHPDLIKTFTRFHDKGFEIVGVSSDTDANLWQQAIQQDQINLWKHVMDAYGTKNDIGELYDIHLLPTKVLINPNGLIVGRYVGSNQHEQLLKDLEKYFTK